MSKTRFNHSQHSGRRKKGKPRKRKAMGLPTLEALRAHRELAYLRNPSRERARKLRELPSPQLLHGEGK